MPHDPEAQRAAADDQHDLDRVLPLMAALAGCGAGCFWLEPHGVLDVDASLLAIWGRSLDELALPYQSALLSFVHSDDVLVAQTLRAFQPAGAPPGASEATFRVLRPDGSVRWVLVREHTIEHRLEPGERVFGLVLDVTTFMGSEHERLRIRTHEAVSTLAAGLAHDFNNLLFAILGNATLALGMTQFGDEHPLRESLREIERASTRASELVQRLSLFSRPPQPKRQLLELTAVIDEALHAMRRGTLPARVQVRIQSAATSYAVLADPKLAEQVVSNLIANAAYAMDGRDGTVDLELEHVTLGAEPWLGELHVRPGRYVALHVRDRGIGMDQATLDRIFEPFFSTRPKGKGLGLGLCIVQGIMNGHGGGVRVESELGTGTVVHVYWPCS